MLDQNTDRMWYVIGAVIVGAAIIFLVNSSFPQLFASVGDTFTNRVTESSKVIDRIDMNKGVGQNLIAVPTDLENLVLGNEMIEVIPLSEYLIEGNTYTITVKAKLGTDVTGLTFGMKEKGHNYTAHYKIGSVKSIGTNLYAITFDYQQTKDEYTAYGNIISIFANSYYDNTKGPTHIEWMKLEHGSVSTPYK